MAPTTNFTWLFYLIVPLVTLILQVILAIWLYRRWWHRSEARTFVVMILCGMVWMLGVLAHVGLRDPLLETVAYGVWVMGAVTAVSAFVVFGSQYTNAGYHRNRLVQALLVGVNVGNLGLIVTYPVLDHDVLWAGFTPVTDPFPYLVLDPGIGSMVSTLLLTLLGLYTEFVMGRYLLSTGRRAGWQLVLLILGALPITVLEYLGYSGFLPAYGLSHAGYGLVLFYGLTSLAVFRFGLFDVQPVARNAVVEKLHDPVVILDDAGFVVDYNDRSLWLWPDLDEQVGQPFEAACPALAAEIEFPLDDGDETTSSLTLSANGQDHHFSVDVSAVRRGRQASKQWYAILLRDVTELERSRWRLHQQNEQLDRVAATISHDLRNPIQVGRGNLELLATRLDAAEITGVDEDQLQQTVSTVDGAFGRMEEIIDDVLTIAREGETVDDPEPVQFADLARDAWGNVETKDATLTVADDAVIQASPSKLRTILENLFRNAIDHGPADVQVTVGTGDEGFYVADDGPGVPDEHADSIFEDGYSTSDEGTGLGLSIVRTMVESHGWRVDLDTDYEPGARFVVRTGGPPITDAEHGPQPVN